jgi:hypothetical protein
MYTLYFYSRSESFKQYCRIVMIETSGLDRRPTHSYYPSPHSSYWVGAAGCAAAWSAAERLYRVALSLLVGAARRNAPSFLSSFAIMADSSVT